MLKRIYESLFVFLFFALSSFSIDAQNIEKNKSEFQQLISNNDTLVFEVGTKIINYYAFFKPDSAFEYIDIILNFARTKHLKNKLALLYTEKGKIYYFLGFQTDATYYFSNALQIYYELNDLYNYSNLLIRLSKSLFYNINDNSYSFKYITEAQEISKRQKFFDVQIKSLYTKSFFYCNSDSLTNAKLALDSAYFLASSINNIELISDTYWFLGYYYKCRNDFMNSVNYFKKSTSLAQNQFTYINKSIELCYLYIENNRFYDALALLEKLKNLAILSRNNVSLIEIYQVFSIIFIKKNDYKTAIEYTQKSLKISKEINHFPSQIENYKTLAELFKKSNFKELSFDAYDKYINCLNSFNERNKTKNNTILNQNLQILLKLKNQELLEVQKRIEQIKNKDQKNAIYFLIIIISLLVLLLFILFYLYSLRRKNELRLRQLTEATLEGLYIHDGQKIIEVNNRMLEMTGYTRNELIAKKTTVLLPEKSQLLVEQKANMYKTVFYQFQLKRKDGSTFDVDLLSKPFQYKGIKAKVISVRDVSQLKTIKKELTETKLLLASLVETSPDGFVILNLDGTIVFASDSFAKIFNRSNKNYFIEMKFLDLFTSANRKKIANDLKQIENGQKIGSQEYLAIKNNIEEFYIECNGNYIKSKDNIITGIFMIVRDVNDRKITEKSLIESQNRFQSLFNNANDAIIIVSSNNFEIVDANPYAKNKFKQLNIENSKLTIFDLIYEQNKETIVENLKLEKAFETIVITSNQGNIFAHISVSEIYFNTQNYFMLIIRNISDIKNQQEELKKYAIQLKNTVYTRDRLFSIVSHDLRGPIGNIDTMLKYISDNFAEFSNNEIKDLIDALRQSSTLTFELTENLLTWAKTQQNILKSHFSIFNLNELIVNTVNSVSFLASAKDIDLNFLSDSSYDVIADENMIKATLRNLLTNAIKFSYKNSKISVSISDVDEFWVRVAVQDRGVGLSKESIEKIFIYNQQLTTQGTNREKGSGLGLQICLEYIKMNEGKLWVESEVGEGTTFYFTVKKA